MPTTFEIMREVKKAQEKIKAREGFKNHVRGMEKLLAMKQIVPTSQYIKKER